jgi:hypothetical protein
MIPELFWQEILPPDAHTVGGYPVRFADGNSAKFWYYAKLSVPLSSVTTPDQQKRLFIDPRMIPLLAARRIVLIDDVSSSGGSMLAGIALLEMCGVKPVALGTAMLQSERWEERLTKGFSACAAKMTYGTRFSSNPTARPS